MSERSAISCGDRPAQWRLPSGWLLLISVVLANACAPPILYYGRSPDRRRTVRVVEVGSKQYVEVDGVGEVGYRAVGVEALVFSADGERLAFPALTHKGWALVLDGRATNERWDGIGEVLFSPDGQHIAYAAQRGSTWYVVQDGVIGPPVAAIQTSSMGYAPQGGRLVYVALDRGGARVIDGRTVGPAFDEIEQLVFSDDGARFAYVGVRGKDARVVIDGVSGDRFARVYGLRFGGQRVAYAGARNGAWYVVVDGEVRGPIDRIGGLCFAGSSVAYVAARGGRWFVNEGGGGDHERVSHLTCAGDAIAYVATDRGSSRLVINGDPHPAYASITSVSISEGGGHHLYAARAGDAMIIVHDGKVWPVESAEVIELALNDEGDHWAALIAVAAERELWMVIDGARHKPFDFEELVGFGLRKRALDPAVVRRWLRADLDRALGVSRASKRATNSALGPVDATAGTPRGGN